MRRLFCVTEPTSYCREEFYLHYAQHFDKEVSEEVRAHTSEGGGAFTCDHCCPPLDPGPERRAFTSFHEVKDHYIMMHGKEFIRKLILEHLLTQKVHKSVSKFRLERGIFLPSVTAATTLPATAATSGVENGENTRKNRKNRKRRSSAAATESESSSGAEDPERKRSRTSSIEEDQAKKPCDYCEKAVTHDERNRHLALDHFSEVMLKDDDRGSGGCRRCSFRYNISNDFTMSRISPHSVSFLTTTGARIMKT